MMRDLIARLEAATGPDRELDAEIMLAVYPALGLTMTANGNWLSKSGIHTRVEAYTASIDAALSLVPEGWAWCVHDVGIASLMQALCVVKASAATPELALCIAALRAREAGDAALARAAG